MDMVVWDAAFAAAAAAQTSDVVTYEGEERAQKRESLDWLYVGGNQMRNVIHSSQSRAALALPGRDILIVRRSWNVERLASKRSSYMNAILIQSRDRRQCQACAQCSQARPGLYPFPKCRRVAGHFGETCANCKWRDHTSRCAWPNHGSEENEWQDLDDDAASGSPPPSIQQAPWSHGAKAPDHGVFIRRSD